MLTTMGICSCATCRKMEASISPVTGAVEPLVLSLCGRAAADPCPCAPALFQRAATNAVPRTATMAAARKYPRTLFRLAI
jgi:hypothetical protein